MGETAKRIIFRVQWNRSNGLWHILRDGELVDLTGTRPVKRDAIQRAAEYCRDMLESEGTPSQLVVHSKNGRICFERTYGNDPRRSKG
jgi:hypothetical protein